MADSTRKRILMALKARLDIIRTANGFATEAGASVEYGPLTVSAHDPLPRLALTLGRSEILERMEAYDAATEFTVTGLIAEDADPLLIEDLLADIKRAVFLGADRSLGGLLQAGSVAYAGESTTAREEGGRHVQCAVTGVVHYSEGYGEP